MSLFKTAVSVLACLCLCLLPALPAVADDGAAEGATTTEEISAEASPEPPAPPAAPASGSSCSIPTISPALAETGGGEVIFLAASGTCTATADCWDGSQVTCSAQGTSEDCSFTDSDCDNDVRGHCWSSDEGTKYCPRCPCLAPPCSKYEGGSCKPGTQSPECDAGGGICAHCFCSSSGVYVCP